MPAFRSQKVARASREAATSVSKSRKLSKDSAHEALESSLERAISEMRKEWEEEEEAFDHDLREIQQEAKQEREAKLIPWTVNESFRFAIGTMVMYKSDAFTACSINEKEILSLPHEAVPNPPKIFYSQADVLALKKRKHDAGAFDDWEAVVDLEEIVGELRLFKKATNDNRGRKRTFRRNI